MSVDTPQQHVTPPVDVTQILQKLKKCIKVKKNTKNKSIQTPT